jgi:death-on-curing family protein
MIEYLTLDELLEIHSHMIAKFGGLRGIRNKTLLQSSIEMPKSTMFKEDLYPTIYDKAAVYLFCIIKNHPFNDANKRTGCAAAYTQVNSKVGNLAKPAPQIWDNEVALKQLNLNKLSDAGGPKDEDVRRSRKPTFEFICV